MRNELVALAELGLSEGVEPTIIVNVLITMLLATRAMLKFQESARSFLNN